jgi:APA family basic amino acid/polyamine antiporter
VAPTWHDFLIAIPIGMIAYTGIETISNMAEEARDEEKTIPRAINRVVIAVFAIYAALPAVALSALPVTKQPNGDYVTKLGVPEDKGGFAGDPILGVVKSLGLGPLQHAGEIYVGLLAATILIIATNAGILGVSRLVYSMGLHRQLPDRLRRLHPQFRTPWIGITLFGLIACITLIPGQAEFLGNLYAFGAMLSFTIAHLAVIRLRRREPDRRRPYRGPGVLRVAGWDLPLFAVFGGLGTGIAFLTVTLLHAAVALAGLGWLIVGVGVYMLYRRSQGLDLVTTAKVAVTRPVVEHEAEYESILVAFDDQRAYSQDAVAIAAKLAAKRRRGIHVLVTITVPNTSPIGAQLPEQERAAQSVIEQARVQGGRRVSGHWEKVRAGQAGRRIVEEAREMRARAIVMPLARRGSGSALFDKALETVLAERPCRVIIESSPVEKPSPPELALA